MTRPGARWLPPNNERSAPPCPGPHRWRVIAGRCAACCASCACTVPVHACTRCGITDEGDNDDADAIRQACSAG
jgi:hypothetical protein